MYDPSGLFKDFKLQAVPEACVGTPESIEARGRASPPIGPLPNGARIHLIPEAVPAGTPAGWRGFRFTNVGRVMFGTVCGVVFDRESGRTVFVMCDTSPATHSRQANISLRVDGPTPLESHILVPPNGYVSPELIANDSEPGDT